MRLDKYLKVSRLIKRRTTAKDVADNSRITVNDRIAKPSTDVSPGDFIEIKMGSKYVRVKVLSLDEHTKKNEANTMYELISERKIENTTF